MVRTLIKEIEKEKTIWISEILIAGMCWGDTVSV